MILNQDIKKHNFVKMNNLKMREAFLNQFGQCLIIDLNDFRSDFLQNLVDALKHILAIGCSIRGGIRIPAFELSILTGVHTKIYELNILRGNFNIIVNKLNTLQNYCEINENISEELYKDNLFLAINSAVLNFKNKLEKKELKIALPKIEISIISTKDYKQIGNIIDLFLLNINVTHINKINLIQVQLPDENTLTDFNNQDNLEADFMRNYVIDGTTSIQFKNYFKSWLKDKSSEIAAIMHFPSTVDTDLKIKCDINECILNPLSLPFGHRFYLQIDSSIVQFNDSTSSSNIPVFELTISSRIDSSSICESMLYGLPFCLTPSKCWRLSYEEQTLNEELFFEICRQLGEEDKYLLAKLSPYFLSDQFLPYFVLIPGNGCFLLKSFASNDIRMPWIEKTKSDLAPTQETSAKVYRNLQNLENIENITKKTFDSGLLSCLVANLEHARPNYNYSDDKEGFSKKRKRIQTKKLQ